MTRDDSVPLSESRLASPAASDHVEEEKNYVTSADAVSDDIVGQS